jgi:tRNA 2-thiouridine synthesizing protein D
VKFSLLILGAPRAGQAGDTARAFCRSALESGHEIYRVFFFDEGVYQGNDLAVTPQDETDPVKQWAELAENHGIDLVLCVASAVKRGMLDETEAQRHACAASIHPAFTLSGLGQLVDASAGSDRLLTFGN